MTRAALCLIVLLLIPRPSAAQNIVGTWRLDPSRTSITAPDGQPLTHADTLTIRLQGRLIIVSFPLHSLSGMGLPAPRYTRPPHDPTEIAYSFEQQTMQPLDRTPRPRAFFLQVHVDADLSGFEVLQTGPDLNDTTFRTSPDGETLTIDTMQGATHLVRVFTRQH